MYDFCICTIGVFACKDDLPAKSQNLFSPQSYEKYLTFANADKPSADTPTSSPTRYLQNPLFT